MLIKSTDIVTLKRYVRMTFLAKAVNSMPDMDAAERKFLKPILTQPVLNALQAQVDNNNITWNPLLNLCLAAAAPLAVWLDLPYLQSQITDGGLQSTSDNAPHQWEYNKIETALVNKGMAALEDLIDHLLENGSTYSWNNDDTKESFIRTGKEFSKYVFLHQPNLTFQQLRPLIKEVEDHFIRPAIGDAFFEELRDKATPTNPEKVAQLLIKKTIAQYTVVRAVERLPVKITPNGLMATIQNNSEAFNAEATASDSKLLLLMQAGQREGDAYQVQLMEYLNQTASTSIFNTYFTSTYYTAPYISRPDYNDYRRGVCAL
jgi:hypothetical protein